VEPAAQRAAHNEAPARQPAPAQQAAQPHQPATEILGNTVDPFWRFSAQTVPTRCSLTMPGGLPFGFVVQPFAAPEDSSRYMFSARCRCARLQPACNPAETRAFAPEQVASPRG